MPNVARSRQRGPSRPHGKTPIQQENAATKSEQERRQEKRKVKGELWKQQRVSILAMARKKINRTRGDLSIDRKKKQLKMTQKEPIRDNTAAMPCTSCKIKTSSSVKAISVQKQGKERSAKRE